MILFSGGQSERNKPYYHYCHDWLQNFVNENLRFKKNILFISWAIWGNHTADDMYKYGQEHWGQFGLTLNALHQQPDYLKAILESDAIIVSGGSIHMLVRELELNSLMIPLKDKIDSGCIYIGTSSGSIITGPTMHTAIEPPFVHIPSHKTLNVLPFQLSAHYYDVSSEEFHNGPTPQTRIKNYLHLNPDPKPVICMKDGSFLYINNKTMTAMGQKEITVFDRKLRKHIFEPNQDMSQLLSYRTKYYKIK